MDVDDLETLTPRETISSKNEQETFDRFFPKEVVSKIVNLKEKINWTFIAIVIIIFIILTFPPLVKWATKQVGDKNVIYIGQIIIFSVVLLVSYRITKR
jgi:hypothetical protein